MTMPTIECTGKWLHPEQATKLVQELNHQYEARESEEEIILFKWIEWYTIILLNKSTFLFFDLSYLFN